MSSWSAMVDAVSAALEPYRVYFLGIVTVVFLLIRWVYRFERYKPEKLAAFQTGRHDVGECAEVDVVIMWSQAACFLYFWLHSTKLARSPDFYIFLRQSVQVKDDLLEMRSESALITTIKAPAAGILTDLYYQPQPERDRPIARIRMPRQKYNPHTGPAGLAKAAFSDAIATYFKLRNLYRRRLRLFRFITLILFALGLVAGANGHMGIFAFLLAPGAYLERFARKLVRNHSTSNFLEALVSTSIKVLPVDHRKEFEDYIHSSEIAQNALSVFELPLLGWSMRQVHFRCRHLLSLSREGFGPDAVHIVHALDVLHGVQTRHPFVFRSDVNMKTEEFLASTGFSFEHPPYQRAHPYGYGYGYRSRYGGVGAIGADLI